MESAVKSKDKPAREQDAIREQAAQRIKGLHEQRQELLKKKQALDANGRGVKTDSAIPTAHMDPYVAEMRSRLVEKKIGAKREFLQQLKRGEGSRQRDYPHLQATYGSI